MVTVTEIRFAYDLEVGERLSMVFKSERDENFVDNQMQTVWKIIASKKLFA